MRSVCTSLMGKGRKSIRWGVWAKHLASGLGAANTFNNIERVYSRAIAFSNRRCSVPLESVLPTSQVCTVSSSIRTAFI